MTAQYVKVEVKVVERIKAVDKSKFSISQISETVGSWKLNKDEYDVSHFKRHIDWHKYGSKETPFSVCIAVDKQMDIGGAREKGPVSKFIESVAFAAGTLFKSTRHVLYI